MALVPRLDRLTALPAKTITDISPVVDVDEVFRYLGYPADKRPAGPVMRETEKWIAQSALLAQPRATYAVFSVADKSKQDLTLQTCNGKVVFHGAIGEFLGAAEYVAVFVATAGPRIPMLASDLIQRGEDLPAMVVNAVGAERAEAAEAAVIHELRQVCDSVGYAPTLPYSPGYCGMKLTEQRTLFSLFENVDTGVTLTDSCLMQPLKSISGLIGLGPAEEVLSSGSPCDRCELYHCAMRR